MSGFSASNSMISLYIILILAIMIRWKRNSAVGHA